eukprot:TRINITY_DN3661_c0_g1_i1.p1 TRINITY_DN3661_c0_g1~~TRINITY_DN3661_c0_g1_i1.p1  ORF type:complete len:604 (-),score=162.69 TRINITY_DN3661_c0_g1_i1:19-1785(-)
MSANIFSEQEFFISNPPTKDFISLIKKHGGKVVNLKSTKSIVLVDPNRKTPNLRGTGNAYNFEYIQDSIEEGKALDLDEYLIRSTDAQTSSQSSQKTPSQGNSTPLSSQQSVRRSSRINPKALTYDTPTKQKDATDNNSEKDDEQNGDKDNESEESDKASSKEEAKKGGKKKAASKSKGTPSKRKKTPAKGKKGAAKGDGTPAKGKDKEDDDNDSSVPDSEEEQESKSDADFVDEGKEDDDEEEEYEEEDGLTAEQKQANIDADLKVIMESAGRSESESDEPRNTSRRGSISPLKSPGNKTGHHTPWTPKEDTFVIRAFVKLGEVADERRNPVPQLSLFKRIAAEKHIKHSWQSVRERYRKKLKPFIEEQLRKLRGQPEPKRIEDDIEDRDSEDEIDLRDTTAEKEDSGSEMNVASFDNEEDMPISQAPEILSTQKEFAKEPAKETAKKSTKEPTKESAKGSAKESAKEPEKAPAKKRSRPQSDEFDSDEIRAEIPPEKRAQIDQLYEHLRLQFPTVSDEIFTYALHAHSGDVRWAKEFLEKRKPNQHTWTYEDTMSLREGTREDIRRICAKYGKKACAQRIAWFEGK